MENLAADLRQSVRFLAKNPGFAAVCVAVLALGIGANTAIFSVVNAILLRPLPYPQPDRIVSLERKYPDGYSNSVSIGRFAAWSKAGAFESSALYDMIGPGLNLGGTDHPEQLKGVHVSEGFFRVFGTRAAIGRTFTPEEDSPHGPKTVVLSDAIWKRRFGADPSIVGRPIVLSGDPYTVIGVLPPSFTTEHEAEAFIPLQADLNDVSPANYLVGAARLRPGVTIAAANAEVKVLADQFSSAHKKDFDKNETGAVRPLRDSLVGDVKTPLFILMGAVAFVLLIACANVANLLLARAAGRQREIAIRTAIGANRYRLVRQLLTESIVLSLLGGLAGLITGSIGIRFLLSIAPPNLPRLSAPGGSALLGVDFSILAFTFGVSLFTGVLFGLFPAIRISRFDVNTSLKESSGRSGSGLRNNRTRSVLVIAEVALALILLVGAGLMIRSFLGMRNTSMGFDAHNVLTLQTSLSGGRYDTTAKTDALARQVLLRLEALPGVESASSALMLPVEGGVDMPFVIEGRPLKQGEQFHGDEQFRYVTGHYFQAFKIPILRGRAMDEHDTAQSARIVVVNEAFAKKYWPGEDPVGKIISVGRGLGPDFEEPSRQVAGVVRSVRETGVRDGDVPVMYIPGSQVNDRLTKLANSVLPISWAIRTSMDPLALSTAVQKEFLAVDPQTPVAKIRTMEQVIAESSARQNFNMTLLSLFAGLALALSAVGIYALMSYSVEQRTQELGIRMALGAARGDMSRLVMGHGLKLALIGVAIGIAGAYGLMRVLAKLLFGVTATDPITFVAVALLLTAVALVASLIPALRATRIDPIIALRYE